MTIENAISSAFCGAVKISPIPNGFAVGTTFLKSDGDGVGFYLMHSGTGWRIEDDGATVPVIEASGISLATGARERAFRTLLAEYNVEYDEDEAELRTASLSESDIPVAAMKFTALLLRMQDFSLLHPELVLSTFREDALRAIEETFISTAEISYDAPISETLALYPADVVLRSGKSAPLAVYLATSDKRVLEAVVARIMARHETHEDCRIMALVENHKSLTNMGLERAMNGLDGVAMFRNAKTAAMGRIRELLPTRH